MTLLPFYSSWPPFAFHRLEISVMASKGATWPTLGNPAINFCIVDYWFIVNTINNVKSYCYKTIIFVNINLNYDKVEQKTK